MKLRTAKMGSLHCLLLPIVAALSLCACSPPSSGEQSAAEPPATTNVQTDAAYVDASIRQVCAERYPDNVGMWAACKRNANQGLIDFQAIAEQFRDVPAMQTSLAHCFERYTANGATNFMMLGACARNQRESYTEFNR